MDIALKLTQDAPDSVEQRFIEGLLREDRLAQQKLYETYYGPMMGVCMRYANNREDARDILHESFIKVFNNLYKYQVGTSLDSWIRRIVVNTSIDFYRKSIRQRTEDMDNARHVSADSEDVISKCSAEEIMKAIQMLPPTYRAVFNLFAIEGYCHQEVAEMLGINESTSRANLVKARRKLQDILAANADNV